MSPLPPGVRHAGQTGQDRDLIHIFSAGDALDKDVNGILDTNASVQHAGHALAQDGKRVQPRRSPQHLDQSLPVENVRRRSCSQASNIRHNNSSEVVLKFRPFMKECIILLCLGYQNQPNDDCFRAKKSLKW